MTIKEFATKYKLVTKTDELGELIILGRLGKSHIYQYSKKLFAAVILPPKEATKAWGFAKKQCKEMAVVQNGDYEGTICFDPTNRIHRNLIFKAIKIKRKKALSVEAKEKLLGRLIQARAARDSQRKGT